MTNYYAKQSIKRDGKQYEAGDELPPNFTTEEAEAMPWAVATEASSSTETDVTESEGGEIEIPDDLDKLGYRELQELAKELGIPANQSADDLRTAIAAKTGI